MSLESIKWNIANNPKLKEREARLADVMERLELTNHEGTGNFRAKLEAERDELLREIEAIKATKPKT